ncbi:gag-pol polyprotein [Tanacetum coccineum]
MQNLEDISNPTTAIDMALVLMAKEFTLNDTTPINNNQRSSSNPSNMQIAQPGMNMDQDRQMLMVENNVRNEFRPNAVQNVRNHVVQNAVQNPGVENVGNYNRLSVDPGIANQYGIGNVVIVRVEANGNGINGNQIRCYNCQGMDHYASNCTVKPRKRDAIYLQKQMQIAQKEEAGIQLTSKEFDFMVVAGACEETEKENANCTLENNFQQASTSGTQSDKAPVYDSAGSAEQYTELLEPILKPHQVQQDESNVISAVSNVEQGGGTVE